MLYRWYSHLIEMVEGWSGGKWVRVIRIGIRLGLLLAGLWSIYPILVGGSPKSSITRKSASEFKSTLQPTITPPDIIFCLAQNLTMEYKVWYNLTATMGLGLTDQDLSTIASAAMNGSTKASQQLATNMGFASDTELWKNITFGPEDFLILPNLSSACSAICKKAQNGSECGNCQKELFKGWLWLKPLKSRCILMNTSRFPSSFVSLKPDKNWNQFRSHALNVRAWASMWIGNLDFERVSDLYQPTWRAVNGIIFVKGKPREKICHPELGYDFGKPYHDCSESRETLDDYVLWDIAKGPGTDNPEEILNVDKGNKRFSFGLFRMDDILEVDYVNDFTDVIKLEVGLGAADSFAGFPKSRRIFPRIILGVTFVLIFAWLAAQEKRASEVKNSKDKYLIKSIRGVLIVILIVGYIWFTAHTVQSYFTSLYSTSYSISSSRSNLPLPRLRVCSNHASNRWFNRTKLMEYGVSSYLFQYMCIVGQTSYPYSYEDPSHLKYDLQQGGGTREYYDLFAFQNLTNFDNVASLINSEFKQLSQRLGIPENAPPYKVLNSFLQDSSKWIISCKILGKDLPNCASHFKVYKTKRHGDVCWEFNQTLTMSKPSDEVEFRFDLNQLAGQDSDFEQPYFGSEEMFRNAVGKYSDNTPPSVIFQGAGKSIHEFKLARDFHSNIAIKFGGLTMEEKLLNCIPNYFCPDIPYFELVDLRFIRFVQNKCGCTPCQDYATGSFSEFKSNCCSADQAFRCLARPQYYCDMGKCSRSKSLGNILIETVNIKSKCLTAFFFDSFYPYSGVINKEELKCPVKCLTTEYQSPTRTFMPLDYAANHSGPKELTTLSLSIAPDVFLEEYTEVYTFRAYEFIAILFSCGGSLLGLSLISFLEFIASKMEAIVKGLLKKFRRNANEKSERLSSGFRKTREEKIPEAWAEEESEKHADTETPSSMMNILFSLYLLLAAVDLFFITYSLVVEIKEQPYSIENRFDDEVYAPPATAICLTNSTLANRENLRKILNKDTTCNGVPCSDFFTISYGKDGVDCLLSIQWMSQVFASQFQILSIKMQRDQVRQLTPNLTIWLGDPVDLSPSVVRNRGYKWTVGPAKGLAIEYSAVKRLVQAKFLLDCASEDELAVPCPLCNTSATAGGFCCYDTKKAMMTIAALVGLLIMKCLALQVEKIPSSEGRNGREICAETQYHVASREQMTSENSSLVQIEILHTHSMVKSIVKSERYDVFAIISFCLGYIGILIGLSAFEIILLPVIFVAKVVQKLSNRNMVRKTDEKTKKTDAMK